MLCLHTCSCCRISGVTREGLHDVLDSLATAPSSRICQLSDETFQANSWFSKVICRPQKKFTWTAASLPDVVEHENTTSACASAQ